MNVKRVREIPMKFFPVRRNFHIISLTVKVNALGIPQWGMPGVSNDWCIILHHLTHLAGLVPVLKLVQYTLQNPS